MEREIIIDCKTGEARFAERVQPRDPETGRYLPYPEDEDE